MGGGKRTVVNLSGGVLPLAELNVDGSEVRLDVGI